MKYWEIENKSCEDGLKEVTKQILSYNNLYSGYPEDLESLIVAAGAPISGTPTVGLTLTGAGNVMGAMMRPNLFTTTALNGMELQQLNNAGIARVRTMYDDAGQGNHTLLATAAALTLAAASPLAIIDEQFLSNDVNPAGGGSQCSVGPSAGGAGTPLAITAAAVSPAALVAPGAFTAG